MDKDTLVSILGPALVIGFIVIIVLAVIADKTANKRFDKKIESKYKIKEQLGPYSTDRILDRFEDFDQVNSGMTEVFNEVRRLIRQGFFERNIN